MTRLVGAPTFGNKTLYSTEHLAHIHKHWVSVASNHEDKRQSIDHSISPVTQVTGFHSVVSGSDHWSVSSPTAPQKQWSPIELTQHYFFMPCWSRDYCASIPKLPSTFLLWDRAGTTSDPHLCCTAICFWPCFAFLHCIYCSQKYQKVFYPPPKLCGSKFALCLLPW